MLLIYAVISTRLRTLENRMLWRIIGPISDQVAEEQIKPHNLYSSRNFSGRTDERRCVGWDMHYAREDERILQNFSLQI